MLTQTLPNDASGFVTFFVIHDNHTNARKSYRAREAGGLVQPARFKLANSFDEPSRPLVLREQHASEFREGIGRRLVECPQNRLAVDDGERKNPHL